MTIHRRLRLSLIFKVPNLLLQTRQAVSNTWTQQRPWMEFMEIAFAYSIDFGLGRLVEIEDGVAKIDYLDVPGKPPIRKQTSKFTITQLQDETRVWISPDTFAGKWRVGRIAAEKNNDDTYWIAFPNEITEAIQTSRIWTRWNEPLSDPVSMLENFIGETPYYFQSRLPAVQELTTQLYLTAGLSGLWSSVVEIHDHQILTARRVLMDPIQRYLLADEVGLGKTIESGLIMRQILSDEPGTKVLVLVPDHLIDQWKRELKSKFHPDQYGKNRVSICGHSEIATVVGKFTLCIIDEVHRLAKHPNQSTEEERIIYSSLTTLCHDSNRVLLLSATPVRSQELDYLAILHLLSPDLHPLDKEDEFQLKLQIRNQIAEIMLGFTVDTPSFLIQYSVNAFRNLITADPVFDEILNELELAVKNQNPFSDLVISVRSHVANKYRLHRRLIRNRRVGQLLEEFPIRGRHLENIIDFESTKMERWELIDKVRQCLQELDDQDQANIVKVFQSVVHLMISGYWPSVFEANAVRMLLGESLYLSLESVTRVDEVAIDRVDALRNFLKNLRTKRGGTDPRKKVIFSTSPQLADDIAEMCKNNWLPQRTFRLSASSDSAETAKLLSQFRAMDDQAFLVCDGSVEEGLNLQFAEMVIFVDVPMYSGRLEQRIGRFDRFSENMNPIEVSIIRDLRSPEKHWISYLQFSTIFKQSVSGLQYALSDFESSMFLLWIHKGIDAVIDSISGIESFIEHEIRELRKQDALDANEEFDFDFNPYLIALKAATNQSKNLQHSVTRWARQLGFKVAEESNGGHRLRITKGRKPLLINESTSSTFHPAEWNGPGSFSREIALSHPGDRLLGMGDPVIDAIYKFSLQDDRGRVAARKISTKYISGGESILFMDFHYLIQPDLQNLKKLINISPQQQLALKAEIRHLSQVEICSKYIGQDLSEVPVSIRKIIDQPYEASESDINLCGSGYEEFLNLASRYNWKVQCRAMEKIALELVTNSNQIQEARKSSIRRAKELHFERLRNIESRIASSMEGPEELESQQLLDHIVCAAIENPVIFLDSCRVTFLTGPV